MKRIMFLFTCASMLIIAGCSNQTTFQENDYQKIANLPFEVGFDLMSNTKANENVVLSPFSIFMALAMLAPGAEDATKTEIQNILHTKNLADKELGFAIASLQEKLQETSEDTNLQIANAIWVDEQYKINQSFKDTLMTYYAADVSGIDAADPNAATAINDWVSQQTDKKINKIVESPLDPNFVALLANAVYFKGNWTYPFDEKLTKKRKFHVNEKKAINIPMMTLQRKFDYSNKDGYQSVRLPYGKDEEMSMYLFLPSPDQTLHDVQNLVSQKGLKEIKKDLEEKEGTVRLPKFTIEEELTLNSLLKSLGMTTAFDNEKANFSKMIQEDIPLWISDVKHKTYLELDEKGTEAAGVTSVEIRTVSAPLEKPFSMKINRPFLFLIADDAADTTLFLGKIHNPAS